MPPLQRGHSVFYSLFKGERAGKNEEQMSKELRMLKKQPQILNIQSTIINVQRFVTLCLHS